MEPSDEVKTSDLENAPDDVAAARGATVAGTVTRRRPRLPRALSWLGPGGTAPGTPRVWAAAGLFIGATAVFTAILIWVQFHLQLGWWVFNLAALAPFAAGWLAIALRGRLRLPVRWEPGFGFNAQVVRRSVLGAGFGLAIVLACVQFYVFFRWKLKPQQLADLAHPFAMPGDVSTTFTLIALGLVIAAALEEFGWRTVLEPTLRQRLGLLGTAVVIGVVWGAWQWPAWLGVFERQSVVFRPMEVVLFTISHFMATISQSLLLVILHQRMRWGQWASAVAMRIMVDLGFFLILDEESGRWQAMFAIGATSTLIAVVGYYYQVRGARARAARTRV